MKKVIYMACVVAVMTTAQAKPMEWYCLDATQTANSSALPGRVSNRSPEEIKNCNEPPNTHGLRCRNGQRTRTLVR